MTPPRADKFAMLDRDGTIIVNKHYLSDPNAIEFAPGALDGLTLLQDAGFTLILVTNQSGIGRGYFDASTLARVHDRLNGLLTENGIHLAAVYSCPHAPEDNCGCRKPAPGLALQAMRDFSFGPGQAVVIGDSDADTGLAAAIGSTGIRIGPGEDSVGDFLEAARRACLLFE